MPAQLSVCNGCCCGRVEKGHNEVPIDTLKEAWEKHELTEHVKLTISTCLGPCRMHNVSLLKTANERTWIGKLSTQEDYLALVEWALDVAKLGEDAKLPDALTRRIFKP